MSYSHFYRRLTELAHKKFPAMVELTSPVAWDHLVSPLELRLPNSIYQSAEAAIRALHAISRRPEYAAKLEPQPGISNVVTPNESVLMAYDFHTDESGGCHLVEVNTNASGFMISSLMELAHMPEAPGEFAPLASLRASFETELKLFGGSPAACSVAISDEEIPEQKMFAEFLMYRDWFRSFGWRAELCETRDLAISGGRLQAPLLGQVDFVYNRSTDFYLENPAHAALREAYAQQLACLSPNPREYYLLADKERLVSLGQSEFLTMAGATAGEVEALRRVLIPTYDIKSFASPDEIWHQRRSLFFKPKRSHGGKSVYRGESVSRKVFERLMQEDVLIQKFTPAQKMPVEDERSVLANWKFDLRFFVYRDRIQLVVARIYQGQVTNFASPLGGFTKVSFI